jgi:hypothetical protein
VGGAILEEERVAAMLAGSTLVAFDMVVLCFFFFLLGTYGSEG